MNIDIQKIKEELFDDSLPCGIAVCIDDENISVTTANSYFHNVVGSSKDTFSLPSLRSLVYPSDFYKIRDYINKIDNRGAPVQLRIIGKGFTASWYQMTAKRFSDNVFVCVFFDINNQKKTESTLRQDINRYSSIFEITNNIVMEYNCQLDIMTMGVNSNNFLDYSKVTENYTKNFQSSTIVHPDDRQAFYSILTNPPKVARLAELIMRIENKEHEYRWVKFSGKSVFDSEGKPWLVLGIITDINDEKHTQLGLLKLSKTDLMTDVLNRNSIEESISEYLKNKPDNTTCALFMIDIDDFKNINDLYGHVAGDEILKTIAKCLKRAASENDIVGRVGGDEFQLFIPDISHLEDINTFADNLCNELDKLCSEKLGAACTISLGISISDKIVVYEELYRYADLALYSAKENGKAHYEIYGNKPNTSSSKPKCPHTSSKHLSLDVIQRSLAIINNPNSVNDVLSYIGNDFALDRISIFEIVNDEDMAQLKWDWEKKDNTSTLEQGQRVSLSLFPAANFLSNIYSSTTTNSDLDQTACIPALMNATAYLQSEIRNNGKLYGYICFAEYDGSRAWLQRDHAMMQFLSSMLAEAFTLTLKYKEEETNSNNMSLLANSLFNYPLIVMEYENRAIVYFNNLAKKVLPSVKLGMDFNNLCNSNASEPIYIQEMQYFLEFYDQPGLKYPVDVTPITWSGKKAFVFCSKEINSIRYNQQAGDTDFDIDSDIGNIFKLTLMKTYEHIYVINLNTKDIKMAYAKRGTFPSVDEMKTSNDLLEMVVKYVPQSQHDTVIDTYSPESLIRKFNAGVDEFTAEYQKKAINLQEMTWVKAHVFITGNGGKPYFGFILLKEISEKKRLEQERFVNERKYRYVLESNYFNVVEQDLVNGSYISIFRKKDSRFIDRDNHSRGSQSSDIQFRTIVHPDDCNMVEEEFKHQNVVRRLKTEGVFTIEYRKKALDGEFYWVSATFCESEKADKALIMFKDISAEKAAQEASFKKSKLVLQHEESKYYRRILDHSNTIVFEWNEATEERYISPRISDWFIGVYDNRDLFDILLNDGVIHEGDKQVIYNIISDINNDVIHTEGLVRLLNHDDIYEWCRIQLDSISEENGLKRVTGTIRNVNNEISLSSPVSKSTEKDALTGLFTSDVFCEKSEAIISRRPDKQFYIIVLDINHFKLINDVHGEKAGDELLRYIADMLRRRMKHGDVYARISGDIFAMCVSLEEPLLIRLIEDISLEMQSYPLESKILLSFGLYLVDSSDLPVSVMCDRAKMAMQTIKGSYFTHYAFYDNSLREKIMSENRIENLMHEALKNKDFKIYLQPKFRLPDKKLSGAEALVRWISKDLIYTPDRFIPLFERNGFIRLLDHYVWKCVCITMRKWLDEGKELVPISVNVSRMHAFDDSFSSFLIRLVKTYKIPVSLLQLEITESAFLESDAKLIKHIEKLRKFGFKFAMDDFGSGYSSLNMLKSVPIDVIKLDKGFINEFDISEKSKTVLQCTIEMVKMMHLDVIAEGVETTEQANFLFSCGCDEIQGYLFSKPVTCDDFYEKYLNDDNREENENAKSTETVQ